VAAVAVVVVVVISALFLTGIISLGGNHSSGPETYQQAANDVSSAMSNYRGGGWKVFVADGVAPPSTLSTPGSTFANLSIPDCTLTNLTSLNNGFTLPAYTGSPSGGVAAGWLFGLIGSGGFLLVYDVNGSVTPVLLLGGSGCLFSEYSSFFTGVSGAIDSSTAAQTAWNAGGSTFVSDHPGALMTGFSLVSGLSVLGVSRPAEWSVVILSCDVDQFHADATVPAFNATINAVTGQLLYAGNSTEACTGVGAISSYLGSSGPGPGSTPLGTVLSLGAGVRQTTASGVVYDIPIEAAASSVTWNDVAFTVRNGSGTLEVPSGANLTVDSITGSSVAVYDLLTSTWSGSSSTMILTTQVLVLNMNGVDVTGGTLTATAVSGFTGQVSTSLG
jgi:hypothetical protein